MLMLFDIFNTLLSVAALMFIGWFVWISSVLVSEKKERQRKGLTDYYDNPIKKEKDETIS
jgi:Na+/phosphate symporter